MIVKNRVLPKRHEYPEFSFLIQTVLFKHVICNWYS
jgi:hypothetical protein